MARLWAMTIDFENVAVGDTLPVLIKWETEETILRYNSLHGELGDDDDIPETLPQRTVESYVGELLGKGFPPERLDSEGSRVDVEHLLPVVANDTISLSGSVVGTADGRRAATGGVRRCRGQRSRRACSPRPGRHQPVVTPKPFSSTTGLERTPMPGISTSTRSPSFNATVTPVEPEKTRSPGWRVICWLM